MGRTASNLHLALAVDSAQLQLQAIKKGNAHRPLHVVYFSSLHSLLYSQLLNGFMQDSLVYKTSRNPISPLLRVSEAPYYQRQLFDLSA